METSTARLGRRFSRVSACNCAGGVFEGMGSASPPPFATKQRDLGPSQAATAAIILSDHLVIATPVYNYNIPANLKAWVDHIVRKGTTLGFDGTLTPRAWAAIVALLIAKKAIPTAYSVFAGCLVVAFFGAMLIAVSQLKDATFSLSSIGGLSPYWLFAVPVPILFALSGTLITKWFAEYDEMACIAVTFLTASVVLIPITLALSYVRGDLGVFLESPAMLVFLAIGTILGAAVGLVIYQLALSATGNDNGFVSMFFLLGPGLTALMSLAMSPWLPQLKFSVTPLFFAGLALVAIPIFVFSWQTRQGKGQGRSVL